MISQATSKLKCDHDSAARKLKDFAQTFPLDFASATYFVLFQEIRAYLA